MKKTPKSSPKQGTLVDPPMPPSLRATIKDCPYMDRDFSYTRPYANGIELIHPPSLICSNYWLKQSFLKTSKASSKD